MSFIWLWLAKDIAKLLEVIAVLGGAFLVIVLILLGAYVNDAVRKVFRRVKR